MSDHARKARAILDDAAVRHIDEGTDPAMYALFLALMEMTKSLEALERKIDPAS